MDRRTICWSPWLRGIRTIRSWRGGGRKGVVGQIKSKVGVVKLFDLGGIEDAQVEAAGCLEVFMTQYFLDGADRASVLEEMGGSSMADDVGSDSLFQTDIPGMAAEHRLYRSSGDAPS